MNSPSKFVLTRALHRISRDLCNKDGHYKGNPCHCKFTDSDVLNGGERNSGCPETTVAALILGNMTDQEFVDIAKRAGINIIESNTIEFF